jgi:hypothetical protein
LLLAVALILSACSPVALDASGSEETEETAPRPLPEFTYEEQYNFLESCGIAVLYDEVYELTQEAKYFEKEDYLVSLIRVIDSGKNAWLHIDSEKYEHLNFEKWLTEHVAAYNGWLKLKTSRRIFNEETGLP